ncbi:unnamed protein product [Sphagnum jensenii]|uniref:Folylpolyglutamate synthase n=1 Tax=Sphagnum jensenii TaxID=128206 RepID=A0ABP0X9V5_9BRYO
MCYDGFSFGSCEELAIGRGYDETLAAMSELITRPEDPRAADPLTVDRTLWEVHFQDVLHYLKVLELEEPLSRLSVIHVAGTKGKGSTCAFVESMLRASGFRTGLFTSPHLFDIRERFRFNGVEVPKDIFLHHFWWCWDRLQADAGPEGKMPGFFRFLTILAIRMFTAEQVDVAILEVGLGGRLDATNVVRSPVVCGVASLGYDHMELLGNTLAMIAGEKAGIFKAGVPAFTAPQPKEAMDVLLKRAKELSISLEIAPTLESYGVENVQLGLEGEHQQINAALAVALCISWACRSPPSDRIHQLQQEVARGGLPDSFLKGLASTKWPGRAEVVHDPSGRLSFYLDGAHSPESMEACANWFCSVVKAEKGGSLKGESNGTHCIEASSDVLLFNCMPKRDPQSLLPPIINTCMRTGVPLHMALFVPPYSSLISLDKRIPFNGATSDLSWQQTVQRHWESLLEGKLSELKNSTDCGGQQEGCIMGSSSAVVHSLPAALEWFRNCTSRHPHLRLQVLVTGSLYLVGDVLRLLKH